MILPITLHGEQRSLPLVLCGPILRRVTQDSVTVWVAMHSSPGLITLNIKNSAGQNIFWGSPDGIFQAGEHLYLCCVTAKTTNHYLSPGQLYYYDLEFGSAGNLASNISPATLLSYPNNGFPGFVLPPANLDDLKIVHGSCRKPHGDGVDALCGLDSLIKANYDKPASRPQILCLTGDQIYADDVNGHMLGLVQEVAIKILGANLANEKINREVYSYKAGLTSEEAKNHLIRFAEFAAMYLLVWSDVLWPSIAIMEKIPHGSWIQAFHKGLWKVRRALANIPTYMIFDDHEITDDWFITQEWYNKAYSNFNAHVVIANGMLAYALFQGWGNLEYGVAKAVFPYKSIFASWDNPIGDFTKLNNLRKGLLPKLEENNSTQAYLAYEQITTIPPWSFRIDYPNFQLIFLDTRTMRGYSGKTSAPALIARQNINAQLGSPKPGQSLTVVVSATPIFSVNIIESVKGLLPFMINKNDMEGWVFNTQGFLDIQKALVSRGKVVILSGDLHYGFTNRVTFWDDSDSDAQKHKSAIFFQCCSSALKNPPSYNLKVALKGMEGELGIEGAWILEEGKLKLRSIKSVSSGAAVKYQFRSAYGTYFNPAFVPEIVKAMPLTKDFNAIRHALGTKAQILSKNNFGMVRFDKIPGKATHEFYSAFCSQTNPLPFARHSGSLTLTAEDKKPL